VVLLRHVRSVRRPTKRLSIYGHPGLAQPLSDPAGKPTSTPCTHPLLARPMNERTSGRTRTSRPTFGSGLTTVFSRIALGPFLDHLPARVVVIRLEQDVGV
jgi:hypothetical protein